MGDRVVDEVDAIDTGDGGQTPVQVQGTEPASGRVAVAQPLDEAVLRGIARVGQPVLGSGGLLSSPLRRRRRTHCTCVGVRGGRKVQFQVGLVRVDDAIVGRDEPLCDASERCETECVVSTASVDCDEALFFEVGTISGDGALVEVHVDIAGEGTFLTLSVVREMCQEPEPPAPGAILRKRLPRLHRVDSRRRCGWGLPGRIAIACKVVTAVEMVVAPRWVPTVEIRIQSRRDDEFDLTDRAQGGEDGQ
jgi:hypothetical protein